MTCTRRYIRFNEPPDEVQDIAALVEDAIAGLEAMQAALGTSPIDPVAVETLAADAVLLAGEVRIAALSLLDTATDRLVVLRGGAA